MYQCINNHLFINIYEMHIKELLISITLNVYMFPGIYILIYNFGTLYPEVTESFCRVP